MRKKAPQTFDDKDSGLQSLSFFLPAYGYPEEEIF